MTEPKALWAVTVRDRIVAVRAFLCFLPLRWVVTSVLDCDSDRSDPLQQSVNRRMQSHYATRMRLAGRWWEAVHRLGQRCSGYGFLERSRFVTRSQNVPWQTIFRCQVKRGRCPFWYRWVGCFSGELQNWRKVSVHRAPNLLRCRAFKVPKYICFARTPCISCT